MTITSPQAAFAIVSADSFKMGDLDGLRLSEHFFWVEVFKGLTLGQLKTVPWGIYQNAVRQAKLMEQVREHLRHCLNPKAVVIVTSWHRTPSMNSHAGGATKSQHLQALATDFYVPGYISADGNRRVQACLLGLKADFSIEITNGRWTHIDSRPGVVFENLGNGNYAVRGHAWITQFRQRWL